MTTRTKFLVFVLLVLTNSFLYAMQYTPQELDEWFYDDSDAEASEVNEGKLVFLETPPETTVHHHFNLLSLSKNSLVDGWVGLKQCHEDIDETSRVEVVFKKERIRNLRVVSFKGIEKAWVEGASVQLANIGKGARLCIAAESRSLFSKGDGNYVLRTGPFMRKFLDGFYPMRVTMDVTFDKSLLEFDTISPKAQKGFNVSQSDNMLHIDTWFKGVLETRIVFHAAHHNSAAMTP